MKYEVIDFHCDALSKMQLNGDIHFQKDSRLDVDLEKLKQGNISLQIFAIYISERLGSARFSHVLDQIHIFQEKVVSSGIRPLYWQEEMDQEFNNHSWGLLSLEGADGLEANLQYLRIAFEQGIRFLGIAWNYANWAADGILEPRNGGFTKKGQELIRACHDLGIILDVSHLSVKGFWELATLATQAAKPFIASHSNAYRICPNPRNLHDEQIKAIISLGGRIGVTFFPNFVKSKGAVHLPDLLRHIEHICSLGGEHNLMFGSDFDGIDMYVSGLENAARYPNLVSELLKHYPEALVRRWLFGNAEAFLRIHLPKRKKTL
ncbi:membrane dipeptidase [Paenibacillus zeisoli]|uniref:Membrane dipeptidase n=1 Tax=Paenibacillus zeisoli TaxID=2496267 RepID=A0A433X703_9BACL|nr:membrane dipeptidase [Paenibacillus zeisoli]RUT29788.1 membrane dipeptidase [Paenibacillus zeisoli]